MHSQNPNLDANSSKSNVANQIKELVQNVSTNGIFQRKLIIFFLFVSFFTFFQASSSSIFFMNPVFQCENIDYKVSQEQACKMMEFCKLENQQTIVAELHLYCDQSKDDRTFIQTAGGVGNWLGIFFAGAISDIKGRRLCFCIGIVLFNMTSIFQFTGVYLQNIPMLLISQIVSGFSGKVIHLNFLVILTRFLSKDSYGVGTLGWFVVGNGVAMIAVAAVNQYFQSWRMLFYIQFIGIFICSIVSLVVLKQDPIYLFDTGKINEAKGVIQSIGEQNGINFQSNQQNIKKIDLMFEMKMQQIENNDDRESSKFDLRQLFRLDIIIKIVLIGIVGCFYNMTVKSIELSLQTFKFSYNFNLLIVGLSNIVGFLSAIYVSKFATSKMRGFIFVSLLYGIIGMLLIFPFCYTNGNIETLVIFLLRLLLCWYSNFYTRFKVDSFPEKYQMACISIIQSISNAGNVLGPLIIQISVDRNINPIFAVNLFRMTVGTLPLLFLSEQKIGVRNGFEGGNKNKLQKCKNIAN